MTKEIFIDPNVRVAGNETFSGFEDVVGDLPGEGATVRVREPESNVIGQGLVTRVDRESRLVYLSVEWAGLVPERLPTPDELVRHVHAAMKELTAAMGRTTAHAPNLPASSGAASEWSHSYPTRDVSLTA